MTDERFNSLVTQSELFPNWFDPIVLELLQALKAERFKLAQMQAWRDEQLEGKLRAEAELEDRR